jgi:hypothetical protein
MAFYWYDKGPTTFSIGKSGGTGPPSGTYYYIVIPVVTSDAGLNSWGTFTIYAPQYYGKRSNEVTITVNGSEQVDLSWSSIAGVDYWIIFRTTESDLYYPASIQKAWYVTGATLAFTDTDQTQTYPWRPTIHKRCHGAYLIDTGQYYWSTLAADQVSRGENAIYAPLSNALINDKTITDSAPTPMGAMMWVSCNVHIKGNATLLTGASGPIYNDLMCMFLDSRVFVSNGSKLYLGYTASGYLSGCAVFVSAYNIDLDYGFFIAQSKDALIYAYNCMFSRRSPGQSDYTSPNFPGSVVLWNTLNLAMTGMNLISEGGTGDVRNVITDATSYPFGVIGENIASLYLDTFHYGQTGPVLFLEKARSFTLRNAIYQTWMGNPATSDDIYFGIYYAWTGVVHMVNPTFRGGTAVPSIGNNPYYSFHNSGVLWVDFEFDLKVVDIAGNPIVNATVTLYDKNGTVIFTTTTDGNGKITTRDVPHASYTGDVLDDVIVTNYYPHRLVITKGGYSSVDYKLVIDHKTDMTVPLEDFAISSELGLTAQVEAPQLVAHVEDFE